MSGGRRKQYSKWDLKEDCQLSYEKVRDSARPEKAGVTFYERESRSGKFSPREAGYDNDHNCSAREADDIPSSRHDLQLSSREPLPGSRGSTKDDKIDDYRENFKAPSVWDEDLNYDTKTSSGPDDWRQQIPRCSPRNGWNGRRRSRSRSRSQSHGWNRSRSPVCELRQESELCGKNRGRPGVSTQLCKDFAAGRCRRGSQCHFSHHRSQSYNDNWDGRHKQAGAPKYSSPHESREYPMKSGRNREGFLERGGEHDFRKSGHIPCKFFAAGNCRNGKNCRFSHGGQALVSPKRRSQDDSLVRGHKSDNTEKLWNGPKWSDATTLSDSAKFIADKKERMDTKSLGDRWLRNHNSDDVKKLWHNPWIGDVSADSSKLSENQNARSGAPGPTLAAWSTDDTLSHANMTCSNITAVSHGGGESNKMEALLCNMKSAGVVVGAPESGRTENWLGDMEMSPEWNYPVKPSGSALNEERGHITQISQSLPMTDTSLLSEQGMIQEASVPLGDAAATMEPMILDELYLKRDINLRDGGGVRVPGADKNAAGETAVPHIDLNFSAILPMQNFDHNGQTSSALPFSSLNSIGQSQGAITYEPSSGGHINNLQNLAVFPVEKTIKKPGTGDGSALQFGTGIQPAQKNMVSNEQLTQLTNLSASLVQFLGNRQQLPQLYAALNSHNFMQVPSSANSEGPIALDSAVTIKPNEAIRSQNQYDTLSVGIEQHDVVNPPGLSIDLAGQKSIVDRKPNGASENHKVSEISGGLEAEEDKKARVENKIPQENGEVQKTDGDDKEDESKKNKDTKGTRAFKFALAEFVKELLKPTWKEGQINKEVYKIIVKKVVDKVIGTMQGTANIPQTQEKIDQYLLFSKSKLTKLVQIILLHVFYSMSIILVDLLIKIMEDF